MTVKPGWTGRSFEDFEIGDIYEHPLGRTITQADNIWFTLLTVNPNPIHFDSAYAARTEFGRPLVDSTFTRKDARKPRPHAPPRNDGKAGDESQPKSIFFIESCQTFLFVSIG